MPAITWSHAFSWNSCLRALFCFQADTLRSRQLDVQSSTNHKRLPGRPVPVKINVDTSPSSWRQISNWFHCISDALVFPEYDGAICSIRSPSNFRVASAPYNVASDITPPSFVRQLHSHRQRRTCRVCVQRKALPLAHRVQVKFICNTKFI